MSNVKTIGILTSGGDAPGMNAAIRAVTMVGLSLGLKVIGIEQGYRGILEERFVELSAERVATLFREGGTILHSSRCLEFHEVAVRDRARKILRAKGIDGLVVIGGNGSLAGALALCNPEEAGAWAPAVIGIPASIDNDIGLTGMCIGVDTAINTIVEACDKISDTASAHDRNFIVEVMGRDSGYLAMTAGVASGADLVLFPESGRTKDDVVEVTTAAVVRKRRGESMAGSTLIIKAEGVGISPDELKKRLHVRLIEELGEKEAATVETRITVLGHVVRGGRPSAFDRLLGSRLGNVAVRALAAGETSKMIAWMAPVQMSEKLGIRSAFDHCCWLADLQATLDETEKLVQGDSIVVQWRAAMLNGLEEVHGKEKTL
ncbi:MAG: 6-phosphofructokinase [Kofleriaceae bacterium]|nr:6-phosphofructokinase [Kofleriaceae bacterium]